MFHRARTHRTALFAGTLAAWAATLVVPSVFGLTRGLHADYFATIDRIGSPAFSIVDPEISTARLTSDWIGTPPPTLSARWSGYLNVDRRGVYAFTLESDDGSSLSLDGRLIIDNGGHHAAFAKSAKVQLAAGSHPILVDYFQDGGPFAIALRWTPPGGGAEGPLPSWRLSQRPLGRAAVRVLRFLNVAVITFGIGSVALFAWLVVDSRQRIARALVAHPRAAAGIFFVLVAIIETWPLATNPARLSRNDNADTVLNEWIIAWVAHQAPRDPLHLYDANIFYPERDTLAYSEPLIVQAAMGAPVLWAGASPVLTYNLLLIAGMALTGWAMAFVITKWTGDSIAGLIAGVLCAFNAYTITHLPHLQAQHVEFLPLALLSFDELLRRPRLREACRLALWFVLQALTSIHLLVFMVVALVMSALVRPREWLGSRFRQIAPLLALAAVIAIALLLPFLLPYWRVSRQGLVRSLGEAAAYSASWRDYLTSNARHHYAWWSYRFPGRTGLFPGFVGTGLVLVAVITGVAWRDSRARMATAFGIAGVLLSFGPATPGYTLLYRLFPLLLAIRATSRFGYLGLVAVAIVGGFGVAELRRRAAFGRATTAMSIILVTLVVLEPLAAPIRYSRYRGIPSIYRRLRSVPDAVAVELPFPASVAVFHNAAAMLNSTAHWKPIVNGYSGFVPASYHRHYRELASFPGGSSIASLEAEGVTHVFVHRDAYPQSTVDELERSRALRLMAEDGPLALYRIESAAPR